MTRYIVVKIKLLRSQRYDIFNHLVFRDEKYTRKQIFWHKAKDEICANKGYTGSLVALYGQKYIWLVFKQHILI